MRQRTIDDFVAEFQIMIFSIDNKLPVFNLWKLGNKVQDFRSKYTIKERM